MAITKIAAVFLQQQRVVCNSLNYKTLRCLVCHLSLSCTTVFVSYSSFVARAKDHIICKVIRFRMLILSHAEETQNLFLTQHV